MRNPRTISTTVTLSCLALATTTAAGSTAPRVLRKEVVVRAPLAEVWHALTTVEGAKFSSSESNIRLEIGGPYEWFLAGEADEEGVRGSEGSRVLAFLPGEMLAFDWTFPPEIPSLRLSRAKTQCVILLDDLGDEGVRVRLAQHGWQEGDDWDAGWDYFDVGWGAVLDRLKASLEGSASEGDEATG